MLWLVRKWSDEHLEPQCGFFRFVGKRASEMRWAGKGGFFFYLGAFKKISFKFQ